MMRTSWQVAIAAEAFATAQLARCGWNVSIQYGGNPHDNDLIAVDGDRLIKVSVKGSNDGSWDLTQNQLLHADYHDVIDTWLKRLTKNTVLFFVQFKDVALDELPRMYLATPFEVGAWLDSAARGRGDTILYEKHEWSSRASAAGTVDEIPSSWTFTPARLDELAKLNE